MSPPTTTTPRPPPLKRLSLSTGPRPLQLSALASPSSPSAPSPRSAITPTTPGGGRAHTKRLSLISYSTTTTTPPPPSSSASRTTFTLPQDITVTTSDATDQCASPSPRSSLASSSGGSRSRPSSIASKRTSLDPHALAALVNGSGNGVAKDKDGLPSTPRTPREREGKEIGQDTPITLVEKHADLLHFIAQKESKCLELRTQLAQHEAELAVLKAKWERIVSRANPTPSTATSSLGIPSVGVIGTAMGAPSSADVMIGIRDGMGKIWEAMNGSTPTSTTIPNKTNMTPKQATRRASSISSVSTAATGSTGSAGTRMSLSSLSSLYDEPLVESPPLSAIATKHKTESEKKDSDGGVKRAPHPLLTPISPTLPKGSNIKGDESKLVLDGAPLPGAGVSSLLGGLPSTVAKKWGEIQKGDTFTKSSKRASLLLSDVSASLMSAIAPLPPASALANASSKDSTLNGGDKDKGLAVCEKHGRRQPSPAISLLDDDSDHDGASLGDTLAPVLTPSMSSVSLPSPTVDDAWDW